MDRGAVFVASGDSTGQQGPVASLLSTAGWVAAARRELGAAWFLTPGGVLEPGEARARGSAPALRAPVEAGLRARVPTVVKTALKDLRRVRRSRGATLPADGPWTGTPLAFVWQRHEVAATAGLDLADRLGVPSVLFVPATQVWEAREWGVRRPGWGSLLERLGEAPALRRADVVACGTELVAAEATRIGAPADRILVTPTGVDVDLFDEARDTAAGAELRERLGLAGRFVVGWVGSFRRFHGLERALDAVRELEGASLLLVGDGPERPALAAAAELHGIHLVSTGTIPQEQLPGYLAAMDVGLVLAPPRGAFHYSPLKLAEYLAAGLAVVAPAVGELPARLRDGEDAVLVPPEEPAALVAALRDLQADPARRAALAAAARRAALDRWSWDVQVRRIVERLDAR